MNRPWDGTAALFVAMEIRGNIRRLGGGNALAIGDRAVHFNVVLDKHTTINLG